MLGDEEYRYRRHSARRGRDDDLDDPRWVLAGGDIDRPGKRTGTSRVHNDFDATQREHNIQLRDASSVGAAANAAHEQGPKEYFYLRVEECPKELISRCGLASESFTTHLDLAESRCSRRRRETGSSYDPTR